MPLANEEFEAIAQIGARRDWTLLYRQFAARLLARAEAEIGQKLGRLVDPQDVVQSAFRTFIRRAQNPNSFKGLPPETDLWGLLLVITLNKIRKAGNFHRAAKRSIDQTVGLMSDSTLVDRRPEDPDLLILRMTVEENLERVEPLKRQMLVMYLSGLPIEEIAEATNRAPRTVYRVISAFQALMEPMLHDD